MPMPGKNPFHSLRFRVLTGVFGVVLLLLAIMVLNNYNAVRSLLAQVRDSNRTTLSLYMNQIDSSYADIETFLAGKGYANTNLAIIDQASDGLNFHLAVQRELKSLGQAIPSYSTIDGLFVFAKKSGVYLDAVQTRVTQAQRQRVQRWFTQDGGANADALYSSHASGWFLYSDSVACYLCRIVRIGGTYAAAWVNVSNLLTPLEQNVFSDAYTLFFVDRDGLPMDTRIKLTDFEEPPDIGNPESTDMTVTYAGEKHLMVSEPSRSGDFHLVALVGEKHLLAGLNAFYKTLPIIAAAVLFAVVLLALAMHRLMVLPIRHLTDAIHDLKAGNLDAKIQEKNPCDEFIEVNQAFDDMTSRIRHLKIDVYEEKLSRQKTHLLQLQQQVTPHFFINCLSSVYYLADSGEKELVKDLSATLSSHLRYSLNPDIVVPLRDELNHIDNYVSLCRIRYPDSIRLHLICAETVSDALVPPMLLQTFVENTVKHELQIGDVTDIHMDIRETERASRRLSITCWDTGAGFSEESLAELEHLADGGEPAGRRIGLANLIQRVRIIYAGDAVVHFSNRPDAGAMIEIEIPLWTHVEEMNHEPVDR